MDRRGLQPRASGIPLRVEFELAVATMGHGSPVTVLLQMVNRDGGPFVRQGKKEVRRTREAGGSKLGAKDSESNLPGSPCRGRGSPSLARTLAEGAKMRHPENQRRLLTPDRRLCHQPASWGEQCGQALWFGREVIRSWLPKRKSEAARIHADQGWFFNATVSKIALNTPIRITPRITTAIK